MKPVVKASAAAKANSAKDAIKENVKSEVRAQRGSVKGHSTQTKINNETQKRLNNYRDMKTAVYKSQNEMYKKSVQFVKMKKRNVHFLDSIISSV